MSAVIERRDQMPTTQDQSTSLLQVIERAARDSNVDIDKMERLMQMHERIVERQAEEAFNQAMTAAQSEMGPISADAHNPQTRSEYATYAKLDRKVRPIYTKHGFSLSFDEADSPKPEHVRVLCYVARGSHKRTYHKDMPADGKGAKGGDVMTKTHAAGAAMAYGMRYLLKGIFNIAVGEEDTDGNDPVDFITEKQAMDLQALAEEVKADRVMFLKYFNIGSLRELPAEKFKDALAALNKKRKQS